MGRLDKAVSIVGIFHTLSIVYDMYKRRQADTSHKEKDARIKELEDELKKLKGTP